VGLCCGAEGGWLSGEFAAAAWLPFAASSMQVHAGVSLVLVR
jgi:hypothetical protein